MQNMNYNNETHNDYIHCNICNDIFFNGYNSKENHLNTEKHKIAIGKYKIINCLSYNLEEQISEEFNYCNYCLCYFRTKDRNNHQFNGLHVRRREKYFLNNYFYSLEVENIDDKKEGDEMIIKTIILKNENNKDEDIYIKLEYIQKVIVYKSIQYYDYENGDVKAFIILLRVYIWSEVKKSGILLCEEKQNVIKYRHDEEHLKNKCYMCKPYIFQMSKPVYNDFTTFQYIDDYIIEYLQLNKNT